MNTKRILDKEKLKDFVGDFNKHFEDLAKWYKKDAERVKNIRESFWEKYRRYSTILLRVKLKCGTHMWKCGNHSGN